MSLTVGFDAPATQLLVNLRPTKVLRLYLQILARASRPFPGKEYGEILDLSQGTKTHGFLNEPIAYIQKGNKKELEKSKEDRKAEVVRTIVKEEPTLITRKLVLDKVEELKAKAKKIPELNLQDLVALFDTSTDITTILTIAYEMNRRKTGLSYTMKSVNWVAEPWYKMLEDFPQYHSRLIKTIRTMSKTKVQKGKKINALHYTVLEGGWLRDQRPYSMYIEPDNVDVSDEVYNTYNAYDDIDMSEVPF